MEKHDTLMRKSFSVLQEMSNRKQHQQNTPMWTPPSSGKTISSKAGQAVREYYEKQCREQLASSAGSRYTPEVEELRKSFLMRPGCPRYNHRATSTSHLESSITKGRLPCNISTISLSSQLSLDDWNLIFQRPDIFESKSILRYCPAASTQSLSGLPKWKSFTEGFTGGAYSKSQKGSRIPWYVTLLQEKDSTLQKMQAELVRLANCEMESNRKDDVISVLREEVEMMQMQLDQAQQGGELTPVEQPAEKKVPEEKLQPQVSDPNLRRRGVSLPVVMQRKSIPEEFRQELERLKMELVHSDRQMDSKMTSLSKTLLKDQDELEQLEKEYAAMQEKVRSEGEEEMRMESGSGEAYEELQAEESAEELIFIKLLEFQRINDELYDELEKVKSDYDMATGAISSLQRQLSFEASQLRKAHSERELLQKELRERGAQLEAMSNKFSNLREEKKHEELMGSIERENYKLRQDVADLESKLTDKSQMIDDLQSNVNRLQAELVVNQHHVGNQLTRQNDLQRQLEILQRAEQQTRVTLETISARFERFRSRIIQATYSTPGTKSPQAEITDDEVLESLQKIITDRLDFHQLLRQKGVKVPSLGANEPPTPPPSSKKKSSSR